MCWLMGLIAVQFVTWISIAYHKVLSSEYHSYPARVSASIPFLVPWPLILQYILSLFIEIDKDILRKWKTSQEMVFYIFLSYLPLLALFLYKNVSTGYHFPLAQRTFLNTAYSARLLAMNSLSCSFIEIKIGFLRNI